LEITRDIAREQGLEVDESGFHVAMDEHRLASGAGETFGELGGEEVDFYAPLLAELQAKGWLSPDGVAYDPYSTLEVQGNILALVVDGQPLQCAKKGDKVEVILPETCFYVESGGQVSDTGIISEGGEDVWQIRVHDVRKPAAGVIVHLGEVMSGEPKVGDSSLAQVDAERRHDIMRNHTATHLLHAELRAVLGEHARQAGSLVAPERLRFDFNHPEAVAKEQIEQIEQRVNERILANYRLRIAYKPLQQAISEGATALFGEKYGDTVRNITIGGESPFSNELCGGTHCAETGDIGVFLITGEGSVASGVRRIEAVTGRAAYELIQRRFRVQNDIASLLDTGAEKTPAKVRSLLDDLVEARKQISALRQQLATIEFIRHLDTVPSIRGVPVLTATLAGADADTLRQMTDRFRQRYPSGVVLLASVKDEKPVLVVSVSEDLVRRGLHAGELAKFIATPLGGSGGGRPTLAQAGGKDAGKLAEALARVKEWVEANLKKG
jgi:alanyl-tRNA synthetase